MNFSEWQQIADTARLGQVVSVDIVNEKDSHSSWQLRCETGDYFVKTTLKRHAPMLFTEAQSLNTINHTETLRCPRVIAYGQTTKTAWLVLAWLSLNKVGNQRKLGQQLAALHRHTATQFGWRETNFIEQSIQYNHRLDDWAAFYRAQRLLPQLRWAKERGLAQEMVLTIETLLERIDAFFIDYQPQPSLLHGNLSAAHIGFLDDGEPIAFNPACSYGDREMDIAIAELSAGFDVDFYDAYQAAYPLDNGYAQRKPLYQLYYLLNGFNQFGGDYAQQIKAHLNNP
jgi:fructosamine-3-kinase